MARPARMSEQRPSGRERAGQLICFFLGRPFLQSILPHFRRLNNRLPRRDRRPAWAYRCRALRAGVRCAHAAARLVDEQERQQRADRCTRRRRQAATQRAGAAVELRQAEDGHAESRSGNCSPCLPACILSAQTGHQNGPVADRERTAPPHVERIAGVGAARVGHLALAQRQHGRFGFKRPREQIGRPPG